MEVYVLNKDFYPIYSIDSYESLLWTERYDQYSDFELVLPVQNAALDLLRPGNYIVKTDSTKTMIIEDVPIENDVEEGDRVIISGRSLESILDRRIIWSQRLLDMNLEAAIFAILNENVVSPTVSARKINGIVLQASGDSSITDTTVKSQYHGEEVYRVVEELCKLHSIGFKIERDASNQMIFQLYTGVDRSLGQTANSPVIFSPEFDNLIRSNFIESTKTYKNVALVGGEGEGTDRKTVTVGDNTLTDLNRRELFVESLISSNNDTITTTVYNQQLATRGEEELNYYSLAYTFEGEAEPFSMFRYGVDYFIGDIVQMINEYGIENRARISELIASYAKEGMSLIPTFTVI